MDPLIPSKQTTDDSLEMPTNEMSTTTQKKPNESSPAFQITSSLIPEPYIEHSEAEIRRTAESELDRTINSRMEVLGRRKNPPAMAIAAYDIATGDIAVAFSGPIPEDINPFLSELVDKAGIGNIGNKNWTNNYIGACAEFRAANQLLQNGSKFENIRFTVPIRPRTRKPQPTCGNCKAIFSSIL